MIQLVAISSNLPKFVLLGMIIICLGLILRYFRQPYVIAYILAGVLLGDDGFDIITDRTVVENMGEFGLILLLFFIGMEINLQDLLKKWKVATLGTFFQILASVFLVGMIGLAFDWSISMIVIMGFVISLSSSAVVIKLLQDHNETQTSIGQDVISVLLMQDILIVPMLIATNYLGGNVPEIDEIIRQIAGGAFIIGGIIWVLRQKQISLPFIKHLEDDRELQVFFAFLVCFGFALFTAFLGLSAALGAFVGGIFVHATRNAEWFHDSLHSFRVMFVALFFVSIGMLIDLPFLLANLEIISLLILMVLISNHFINAAVLHAFGDDWKKSLYGGALLGQIGELSFIIAASAYHTEILSEFGYQLTIIVISLSLLISPFWIGITKKLLGLKTAR